MNAYSKQKSDRIEWIDFGKGLTVLMVVFGHVVLGLFESKRFEDSQQWLLFVTQIFICFISLYSMLCQAISLSQ